MCVCVCVCVCVCRKYSYRQFNKNHLFTRACVCTCWGKSIESMCSWLAKVKKDKKLTLLTYMCMRACTYVCDRKYGPFIVLSSHMCFF